MLTWFKHRRPVPSAPHSPGERNAVSHAACCALDTKATFSVYSDGADVVVLPYHYPAPPGCREIAVAHHWCGRTVKVRFPSGEEVAHHFPRAKERETV